MKAERIEQRVEEKERRLMGRNESIEGPEYARRLRRESRREGWIKRGIRENKGCAGAQEKADVRKDEIKAHRA